MKAHPPRCWKTFWKRCSYVRRYFPCGKNLYPMQLHRYEETAQWTAWYHPIQLQTGSIQQFPVLVLWKAGGPDQSGHYEGDGFCLLYKRYENGRLQWPRTGAEDGNCSISNSLAENCIRPFVIGRKNWLFSGSPKGADASAGIYTLVETAKANGLAPMKYIKYILSDMPGSAFLEHPEYLDDYLPWNPLVKELCQ